MGRLDVTYFETYFLLPAGKGRQLTSHSDTVGYPFLWRPV